MTTVSIISVGGPASGKVVVDSNGFQVVHWPGTGNTYVVAGGMILTGGTLTVPNVPCVFRLANDSGDDIIAKCVADTGVTVADGSSELLFCDGTGVTQIGGT